MNIVLKKTLAVVTAFIFSSSLISSRPLNAAPESSLSSDTQGSTGKGSAYGSGSLQASGSGVSARGNAAVGGSIPENIAGAEASGGVSGKAGGVPFNVTGNAEVKARGGLDSEHRPTVNTQTNTDVTGSVGGQYETRGSASSTTGPYAQGSKTYHSPTGNTSVTTSGRVGSVTADGSYSATANSSGVRATAHGNARAVVAEGEVQARTSANAGNVANVDVSARGSGFVGAEATGAGHAAVDRRGVRAGTTLDGVVGARQSAEVGGTLNLLGLVKVTARLKGESIEGAGGTVHADVHASLRKVGFSAGAAAAAGVGGGTTMEFEVDVSGITDPIGNALGKVAGKAVDIAKGLFNGIKGLFGGKDREEEPACAAEGDSVYCGASAAGGPRPGPGPGPDPAQERRRQEEERRRQREERKREEEEQKRREKEEKERKQREEKRKKAEETWRKLPPLSKPKSGGATGRVFDPKTGEITEGVMDPDGTTTIIKRDEDGNIISTEERKRHSRDESQDSAPDFGQIDAIRQGGLAMLGRTRAAPTAALDGTSRDIGVSTGGIPTDSPSASDHHYSPSDYPDSPS